MATLGGGVAIVVGGVAVGGVAVEGGDAGEVEGD